MPVPFDWSCVLRLRGIPKTRSPWEGGTGDVMMMADGRGTSSADVYVVMCHRNGSYMQMSSVYVQPRLDAQHPTVVQCCRMGGW